MVGFSLQNTLQSISEAPLVFEPAYAYADNEGFREAIEMLPAPEDAFKLHIGYGGLHNLDVVAARKSDAALLLAGVNQNQSTFWSAVLNAIRLCETADDCIAMLSEGGSSAITPLMSDRPYAETAEHFRNQLAQEAENPASWLYSGNNAAYNHIRELVLNDRIAFGHMDMASFREADELCNSLIKPLQREHKQAYVDTLYVPPDRTTSRMHNTGDHPRMDIWSTALMIGSPQTVAITSSEHDAGFVGGKLQDVAVSQLETDGYDVKEFQKYRQTRLRETEGTKVIDHGNLVELTTEFLNPGIIRLLRPPPSGLWKMLGAAGRKDTNRPFNLVYWGLYHPKFKRIASSSLDQLLEQQKDIVLPESMVSPSNKVMHDEWVAEHGSMHENPELMQMLFDKKLGPGVIPLVKGGGGNSLINYKDIRDILQIAHDENIQPHEKRIKILEFFKTDIQYALCTGNINIMAREGSRDKAKANTPPVELLRKFGSTQIPDSEGSAVSSIEYLMAMDVEARMPVMAHNMDTIIDILCTCPLPIAEKEGQAHPDITLEESLQYWEWLADNGFLLLSMYDREDISSDLLRLLDWVEQETGRDIASVELTPNRAHHIYQNYDIDKMRMVLATLGVSPRDDTSLYEKFEQLLGELGAEPDTKTRMPATLLEFQQLIEAINVNIDMHFYMNSEWLESVVDDPERIAALRSDGEMRFVNITDFAITLSKATNAEEVREVMERHQGLLERIGELAEALEELNAMATDGVVPRITALQSLAHNAEGILGEDFALRDVQNEETGRISEDSVERSDANDDNGENPLRQLLDQNLQRLKDFFNNGSWRG